MLNNQFCTRGHDRTLPGAVNMSGNCKECKKLWKKTHPSRIRKWKRLWCKNNPDKIKLSRLKCRVKKYKLTVEEYNALLLKQNNKCAICDEIPIQGLSVDHDHVNGSVRGLLCLRCNVGMSFIDNTKYLENALMYKRVN